MEANIWLNYVWTLDSILTEEYTSNQWEIKTRFKLIVKKDADSKFMVESNKNPTEDFLSKWITYAFPVWVNTFNYKKDWVDKIWTKFYLRETPVELKA